ncbi:L-threonylcarbamoyladenylate synthase [Faecalicoccus pleomorphus]|uniref:L-threonylcarbamoyladenylate synthase n=1 Tax=Faecalicoccus pleomorphus TaxID=1323 RepID=UPI0018991509|nr:L-threonylcarbamoyladenylate synthase [Faecalicoccus pleomorphus]MDB7984301.1 L-threonylcarbamoyladenylate synthase [Faecalicoccus pleomorphus]
MKTYSKEEINAVADALQNHKIIALPTDTVYGVGVMYGDLNDLQRLKNAKHRPETKPIPMMVSSIEHMEQVAVVDERVKKIAKQFLPGALTLVLKVKDSVPKEYTNGLDTIAIRIPDEPFILHVIDELNAPLLVSSANQSGAKTALTSDDVLDQLPDIDGLVLGKCRALQASTIVDCTQENLKILREGPITLEQLESCL